ncbi:DUF2637 domain-containing protein [Streptomyces sp. NBC_01788]|uniref:DUF2637 domain-containing protein n=1 Tax=Streptomyces sp. NBC_01788 TaxID=2975940 RepID=UPI002DDB653A|nr:DUF2637 domain-containing protein [Streptomyces sp. NBC_01788]WSB27539.1 DUF2637 domain-containing protein [Streptomyces sp. NBC_01788]
MTHPTTPTQRHRLGQGRPAATKQAIERYALAAAGVVIVLLTAGGFWLSYAHLAEVAGQHGLGNSATRQWAWPATLDAFIVAGELLMLRAGLRRVTDGWAIALTATGSVGSIALNVAGVSGTDHAGPVPPLDYVVAAVPPAAALLAFGVLMRQVHQLVDQPADQPNPVPVQAYEPPATPSARPSRTTERPAPTVQRSEPLPQPVGKSRGGRPASATVEELAEIGRIAAAEKNRLNRDIVQQAIRAKGHTVSGKRLTEVMAILRPELATGAETNSG